MGGINDKLKGILMYPGWGAHVCLVPPGQYLFGLLISSFIHLSFKTFIPHLLAIATQSGLTLIKNIRKNLINTNKSDNKAKITKMALVHSHSIPAGTKMISFS